MPKYRFMLEKELNQLIKKAKIGQVTGGGMAINREGMATHSLIEIKIKKWDKKTSIHKLVELLNKQSLTRGSRLYTCYGEILIE